METGPMAAVSLTIICLPFSAHFSGFILGQESTFFPCNNHTFTYFFWVYTASLEV